MLEEGVPELLDDIDAALRSLGFQLDAAAQPVRFGSWSAVIATAIPT